MARGFRSVQFKIILAVAAIMIVGIAAAITVSTVNQRNNLINAARNTLAVNTEMLNVTVRNLMLAGEAQVAVGTIAGLRDLDAFLEFEVFRSDGTVAFSDYSTLEFVNTYQDMVMFDRTERTDTAVTNQIGFEEALSSNTPFEYLDVENRAMDYWFPILNYAECRTCHGDDNFVRGVSHFSVSLDGIYSQVRQAGITLSSFLIALGLILFLGILFQLRRVIIKPVLADHDKVLARSCVTNKQK